MSALGIRTAATSCRSSRMRFAAGAGTTVHVARFDRSRTSARVIALDPPAQLREWCHRADVADAVVGGFFVRSEGTPLGALRIGGQDLRHVAFDSPWDVSRACVEIREGAVAIAPRHELPRAAGGDLLQAGPLLLRDGRCLISAGNDPEGFSEGAAQFDSDITAGRYPRAALGVNGSELIALVCDGRGELDQGLTLEEMARAMAELGATTAINLDGGGSASLVIGGELRNHPREEHGIDLLGGRAVSTALVFEERRDARS